MHECSPIYCARKHQVRNKTKKQEDGERKIVNMKKVERARNIESLEGFIYISGLPFLWAHYRRKQRIISQAYSSAELTTAGSSGLYLRPTLPLSSLPPEAADYMCFYYSNQYDYYSNKS